MGLTKYQFFGKKYIFLLGKLLEIMRKKCTNKNISSFSHLNFGIEPQMLMGWEYFCTYLSLKQGKSTSCFQNVKVETYGLLQYNPIHYSELTFAAGLTFNMLFLLWEGIHNIKNSKPVSLFQLGQLLKQ